MKRALPLFGLSLALIVGAGTALFVGNALHGAAMRFDPSTRYELSFVIDGERYVTDHDLTWDDCDKVLRSTVRDPDAYRHGAGSYGCDMQH
jgi:hypothetical protein